MFTAEKIAELLRCAETAHAEYEKTLGHRDDNWADWYAEYIFTRLNAEDLIHEH